MRSNVQQLIPVCYRETRKCKIDNSVRLAISPIYSGSEAETKESWTRGWEQRVSLQDTLELERKQQGLKPRGRI